MASRIRDRVGEEPAFLAFDVDFLDPVYAPGTGTPEVGGFSTAVAYEIISLVAAARRAASP